MIKKVSLCAEVALLQHMINMLLHVIDRGRRGIELGPGFPGSWPTWMNDSRRSRIPWDHGFNRIMKSISSGIQWNQGFHKFKGSMESCILGTQGFSEIMDSMRSRILLYHGVLNIMNSMRMWTSWTLWFPGILGSRRSIIPWDQGFQEIKDSMRSGMWRDRGINFHAMVNCACTRLLWNISFYDNHKLRRASGHLENIIHEKNFTMVTKQLGRVQKTSCL